MSEPAKKKSSGELIWENRLALWLPGPPIVGAIIITTCLVTAYLTFVWWFGVPRIYWALLIALLVAYFVMVPRYLTPRDSLDRLLLSGQPLVAIDRRYEISSLLVAHDEVRRSRWAGALGVLVAFSLNELAAFFEGADLIEMFQRIHSGTPILPMWLALGWVLGRGLHFSRTTNHELPLPDSSEIDVLHLETLYSIGRSGLRRAFVWILGVAILGLATVGTVFGLNGSITLFAIGLVTGLVALLRPAQKVRNLIRNVKRVEVLRLEPLIQRARDDALSGDVSTQGTLTDLMTYRDRIELTAEWPFNSSSIVRFGLYLMIPVGSMVGGALMERVVDMVLD